ncbi:GNAT family N-acetyltransferase [Streptosporangium canum]|uniref:GNAT family N-acetyltransferase n=1 Tax=Streptosporangium canum TaxID=324952 RepID=UPI0037A15C8A
MTAKMPDPVTLQDHVVRLEPLTLAHVPDLFLAAGGDEEVWRWQAPTPRDEDELRRMAEQLIGNPAYTAFAVILKETGRAVGWTTYIATPGYADSIEIGWTWYGRAVWRSAVNTACKILLIDYAFDKLGVNRVQLKTDNLNTRSQAAIQRIGGLHEGVLRRQRRRPDGTWRDTVYFSILDDEWPAHRARLLER